MSVLSDERELDRCAAVVLSKPPVEGTAYTPTIGAQLVKPLRLTDQISISPRLVADVALTGS